MNEEQVCYTEDTENPRVENNNKNQNNKISNVNEDDDGEDVILFVEYKYCTVCHIE